MDSELVQAQVAENRKVIVDPPTAALLARNAPVAVGVSGGKDSQAVALAVASHLDAIGHTGPRLLIHADLGRVEWTDSLPTCERLADHLGWELVTVQRKAGGMMERWLSRWDSSVRRYQNLETVRVVLPFSTPQMRFCTSELKTQPIQSALRKRFPNGPILSVTGIRAQESTARARKPASAPQNSRCRGIEGEWRDWNAILHWSVEDVFAEIEAAGLRPHEAYRIHGSTRVSCRFCIMGSLHDLTASAGVAEHADLYREMVELEVRSTFGFQSNRWLADIAPHLLSPTLREAVADAKRRAVARVAAESAIPKALLFSRTGWPACVPTRHEADILAGVRRTVAGILGIDIAYDTAAGVQERIEELHTAKAPKA